MKFINSHVLMIVLAVASIQSDNVEGGDATVRRDKKKTAHRLVRGQRKLDVLNAGCGGAAAAAANSPAADAVASSPEPEKSSGKSGGKSGKDKRRRNLANCDEEPGSEAPSETPSETSESEAVSGVDEVSQKDLPTNQYANSDPPPVPGRDQTSNIEEVWVDGN